MAIESNWTVDYVGKTITHHTGGLEPTQVWTTLEMYSWLMDLFDDSGQMDDDIPMSAPTPLDMKIGQDANGNLTGWAFGADTDYRFLKGGSIYDATNGDLWSNIYNIGSIVAGSQIYIIQDGTEITEYWGTGDLDILVKVSNSDVLIDNGDLLLMVRDMNNTFDHSIVDCSAGGRNVASLNTTEDRNNETLTATVGAYAVTISVGSYSEDLDNGNGVQPYDISVDCNGHTVAEVYEYLKYAARHDSAVAGIGDTYLAADPAYTPIKVAPLGTFAGGKFFGAQGVWLHDYDVDDAQNFQLIDSDGDDQIPPNVVPIKVTSVVVGDQVAVFILDAPGGSIISIVPEDNFIHEVATSTTAQTTHVWVSDVPVLVRVRKYGILPFEVESTVTSTGMSVAAIRTTDGIVS